MDFYFHLSAVEIFSMKSEDLSVFRQLNFLSLPIVDKELKAETKVIKKTWKKVKRKVAVKLFTIK